VGYDAAVLASVPEYRVIARNTSAHSTNKIHDDEVARRLGYRGGLVPGATVYAYLTRPILAALGREWLARGRAAVRFVKPVYGGEELTLRTTVSPGAADALDVSALNPAGELCAVATSGLTDGSGGSVSLDEYPLADLPAERPPASRGAFERLAILGSPTRLYDGAVAAEYREKFEDPDPLYRGAGALVHPAFYLEQGNRAVDQNVCPGPWIHVASEVRHLGLARVGARVTTRGRVQRLFEKKGNEFVELDLLLVADDAQPIAHLRHLAIYLVRPRNG
jgi:acyl dehydratase